MNLTPSSTVSRSFLRFWSFRTPRGGARSLAVMLPLATAAVVASACQPAATPAPAPAYAPYPQQPGYAGPPGYPQPGQPYAQPPYAPQPGAPQPTYAPQSAPGAPAPAPVYPSAARPLLPALVGSSAWQNEVRVVLRELVSNLSPDVASRVATVPIVFDPNPNDVNAFASCDDSGAPFVAGTEGLLEAIDAIAQTKASDELYGTQAYEAYCAYAAPRLVSSNTANAMLPGGIIPAQAWADPRRVSRAHEMFDEIVAFTFGHELSHHYLGHTGCANGQQSGTGPAIARLGQLATQIIPGLNQPNEIAADSNGCTNTLTAGRARRARAYGWTEEGGLWLLDFFARLERASGSNPFLGFLQTHPNPSIRIPIVQVVATTWRMQHPG